MTPRQRMHSINNKRLEPTEISGLRSQAAGSPAAADSPAIVQTQVLRIAARAAHGEAADKTEAILDRQTSAEQGAPADSVAADDGKC